MTNEWLEFKAYTDKPVFKVESKKSVSFLGRFTTDMISRFVGFNHIFVILARGIIFHNTDGSIKDGDPYSRIEETRRFLCAWCSIPERKHDSKVFDGKFETNFRNLHPEFPCIVDEDGKGWYYRYMEKLSAFIKSHQNQVNKYIHFIPEHFNDWKKEWKNKVIHYQTSLYANTTQSEFPLLFDTAILKCFNFTSDKFLVELDMRVHYRCCLESFGNHFEHCRVKCYLFIFMTE